MQAFDSSPDSASAESCLAGLNAGQRAAVETTEGALLVLAGAGTGKTRVLTTRLAHILRIGRAWPGQILAVTFTNKAAQEMRARVATLIDQPVDGMWLGTFHALAARMLRRHAELAGLSSNFTILDTDDQLRLLKQIMEGLALDPKKNPPKQALALIDQFKNKGKRPEDLTADEAGSALDGKILTIYRRYQTRLKEINACDFGDLLLHMIAIFKDPRHAEVLADYHRRFKYILVDEYQDTNVAQYLWLRLLAQGSQNICCVGDDDQSIYGWRGAEVGNILKFERDFPGAQIVRLEQNYRSTAHILGAANAVIAQNEGRLGKTLFTAGEEGEKISVRGLWDGPAEARFIAEEIEALQGKNWSADDIAVLVRTGFQMRVFEERFIQMGIPYKVIGGPRFYERMEIRDALAYFRVIVQPADDLALERIINTPKRSIGAKTVQKLYEYAREKGISLYQSAAETVGFTSSLLGEEQPAGGKTPKPLSDLIAQFERWRSLLQTANHTELAGQVLEESGYMAMWQTSKEADAPGRVENLKELVTGMAAFESLPEFLEHVALVLESADNQDGAHVTLMTLHGAKGLEFGAVFLPGWEEGLFPSQRSMDEQGLKGLEEERRLAYVGITRARRRAWITHAANRQIYGNWVSAIPSRFIDELPSAHVDLSAETGLSGGAGRSRHWDSSGISARDGYSSRPTVSERTGKATVPGEASFIRGGRVHHDKFGSGTVVHIDGHKLDIKFDQAGQKRVMDSFVTIVE